MGGPPFFLIHRFGWRMHSELSTELIMSEHAERSTMINSLNQLQRAWSEFLASRNIDALLLEMETNPLTTDEHAVRWLFLTALDAAEWGAAEAIARKYPILIHPPDPNTDGPLHRALWELCDCPAAIAWLLDHGAERDRRGANNWTPLHFAATQGFLESVRTLLDYGTPVDIGTGIDGDVTPLMEATSRGHEAVAQLLQSRGADKTRI